MCCFSLKIDYHQETLLMQYVQKETNDIKYFFWTYGYISCYILNLYILKYIYLIRYTKHKYTISLPKKMSSKHYEPDYYHALKSTLAQTHHLKYIIRLELNILKSIIIFVFSERKKISEIICTFSFNESCYVLQCSRRNIT